MKIVAEYGCIASSPLLGGPLVKVEQRPGYITYSEALLPFHLPQTIIRYNMDKYSGNSCKNCLARQ